MRLCQKKFNRAAVTSTHRVFFNRQLGQFSQNWLLGRQLKRQTVALFGTHRTFGAGRKGNLSARWAGRAGQLVTLRV
jgi:hypothetical protein